MRYDRIRAEEKSTDAAVVRKERLPRSGNGMLRIFRDTIGIEPEERD